MIKGTKIMQGTLSMCRKWFCSLKDEQDEVTNNRGEIIKKSSRKILENCLTKYSIVTCYIIETYNLFFF